MYKYVATFVGGAILGAFGTLLWLRKEYNKKVEEAVIENEKKNSVTETKKEQNAEEKTEEKPEARTYEKVNKELLKRHGYSSDDAESVVRDNLPDQMNAETPYGISGDDYLLTRREYDKVTLMYYDDGVLACEDGTVVEDILYVLGPNWMKEIGKYDDDTAYIRNDRSGADYEIICEHMTYAQMYKED